MGNLSLNQRHPIGIYGGQRATRGAAIAYYTSRPSHRSCSIVIAIAGLILRSGCGAGSHCWAAQRTDGQQSAEMLQP